MDSPNDPDVAVRRHAQDGAQRLTVARGTCPRCGRPVPPRATGRPATWCSQACRRAAYEERRAAAGGAVAIRIVDRVEVKEHGLSECTQRVIGSPAACRRVLQALAQLARDGVLGTDPKWDSALTAARGLTSAVYPPTQRRQR